MLPGPMWLRHHAGRWRHEWDQGCRDVEGDDGVTCAVTSRDDDSRDRGRDGDDGVAESKERLFNWAGYLIVFNSTVSFTDLDQGRKIGQFWTFLKQALICEVAGAETNWLELKIEPP